MIYIMLGIAALLGVLIYYVMAIVVELERSTDWFIERTKQDKDRAEAVFQQSVDMHKVFMKKNAEFVDDERWQA